MIKVSIIVPVYNTSKYLNKCIDSLLNQSEKDIEIIIIDDGSTDNSKDIIKKYDDNRIKYFYHDNHGIGYTRNRGISISRGKYVMFIDSDDYIDKNCVKEMYNYALKNNSDIVISDFYKDYDGRLELIKIPDFKSSCLLDNPKILSKINLGPCNKLFKKSLIESISFSENCKYEDVLFVITSLINANKISKLNKSLSYYVIHNNSQTTIRDEKISDILKINEELYKLVKDKDYLKEEYVNVVVMMLTDYTIQGRYIKDSLFRNKFIDDCFNFLDKIDSKWRDCSYLKQFSFIKRLIKTNKYLTKLYDSFYYKFLNKSDNKKVMFIASTGGHLNELMQLKELFNNYDYSIVTEKTKNNLDLKNKYNNRVYFLISGTYTSLIKKIIYPFKLLLNCFISLYLMIKIRPDVVISTGAHSAGPMCCLAKIFGKKLIFIETFANSNSPTKTGKIVYKFADYFIVQWESMLEFYPDAIYGGWIY